jgi:hypothetical protein
MGFIWFIIELVHSVYLSNELIVIDTQTVDGTSVVNGNATSG